jgi:hypothetical protein
MDMTQTITPKSTQTNADDFLTGPRTITITAVRANGDNADQPVAIEFSGDEGKPYLPCRSMRRVLVALWGVDAKAYVGRSLTLYCDPNVMFGGLKVGGIRISHASHIEKPITMALTATRAKRAPYTVQPLLVAMDAAAFIEKYDAAASMEEWETLETSRAKDWKRIPTDDKPKVKAVSDAAKAALSQSASQEQTP